MRFLSLLLVSLVAAVSATGPFTASNPSRTALPSMLKGLATYSPSPVSSEPLTKSNPLAGKSFYVDPNSQAAQQARYDSRIRKISTHAQGVWLGGWGDDVATVKNTLDAAGSSVPVFVFYYIPQRDCGGASAGGAPNADAYKSWVTGLADAIGRRDAVVIMEPDALAFTASCADSSSHIELIKESIQIIKKHSSAHIYVDIGNPNWLSVETAANLLKQVAVDEIDGFSINVSNFVITSTCLSYGEAVSAHANGAHFIVDTSRNGRASSDNNWCNPSGKGLGAPSSSGTGHALVDAFFWVKSPGESDGPCGGCGAAGSWCESYALELIQNASW